VLLTQNNSAKIPQYFLINQIKTNKKIFFLKMSTKNNNFTPAKPQNGLNSPFQMTFSHLFKLLYLVVREIANLFIKTVKPHLIYYSGEAKFHWQRLNIPTWKVAIVAGLFVLSVKGADTIGFSYFTPFRTQSASLSTYTESLDDEGSMAPATLAELHDADNRAYIKEFATIAVAEMHRTQIPASISMAQAIVESRAGKGRLARTSANHFGIKCFSRSCTRGHCRNFEDDSHKDFFRVFASPEESWRAHSAFLQGKRYEELFANGKNYSAWADGLQEKGYATADNYASTLVSIIKKYRLEELDEQ
jgi:flagellum-specific peptidoglycan hydrolase FlgJ